MVFVQRAAAALLQGNALPGTTSKSPKKKWMRYSRECPHTSLPFFCILLFLQRALRRAALHRDTATRAASWAAPPPATSTPKRSSDTSYGPCEPPRNSCAWSVAVNASRQLVGTACAHMCGAKVFTSKQRSRASESHSFTEGRITDARASIPVSSYHLMELALR